MAKEKKLEVFEHRSVLHIDGKAFEYEEGAQSQAAKARYKMIRVELENGFFDEFICNAVASRDKAAVLDKKVQTILDALVNSITSEVGRAVVALCLLQLTLKCINDEQSIRLHKGGGGSGSFGWKEGISMRALDRSFITPALRKHNLLKLNNDGFMMTRTLAENYPYSTLYKAAIRGEKDSWLHIVDLVESGQLDAKDALTHCIVGLHEKSARISALTENCLAALERKREHFTTLEATHSFISQWVENSNYSSRIFEIALHCAFHFLHENSLLDGDLKPLSQMRSANKKHKNIGDVEIVALHNDRVVFEAWDAKYGKPYLRDELDELSDKLENQPSARRVGFVVNSEPSLDPSTAEKIRSMEDLFGAEVKIMGFKEWLALLLQDYPDLVEEEFCYSWASNIVQSLGQSKRDIAPIDEPCDLWIGEFLELLDNL